jgi:translation initiation factor IF-2
MSPKAMAELAGMSGDLGDPSLAGLDDGQAALGAGSPFAGAGAGARGAGGGGARGGARGKGGKGGKKGKGGGRVTPKAR